MKKVIACLVIVSFLVAMPRPVYADHGGNPAAIGIAFGAVALIIAILTLGTSRDRGKAIEAKERVDIEHIKASAASGAKVSCGEEPCENSYESSTAGSAVVRHAPIVQPIRSIAYVQPLSRSERDNGESGDSPAQRGESALYRAGARVARNGFKMECNSTDDYCRGYNAAKERR